MEAGRRVWAIILSLLGGQLAAPASAQQPGFSIDAGALNMQYADSIDATAIAVTPSLWIDARRASFSSTATLSQFSGGGWSAQGSADGSVFTRRIGFLLGELEGNAGGSTRNDASRTGQLLATARAHFAGDTKGLWIGVGAGGTWDGIEWRDVRQGEAAAWTHFGNGTATITATPIIVDDSIRYTDAQIFGSLNLSRVDLDASAGFRSGNRLPTLGGTAKSWGSASITGWIASRIALVASAGTYPVDLTQGFPGGRFASLSIRIGSRRTAPSNEPSRTAPLRSAFVMKNISSNIREIRIHEPSARTVEIMGDFTTWNPVSLERNESGWWTIALPIPKGIHEMNMRVNGGPWIVPAGLPRKADEFGSAVGVLLVQM